MFSKKAAACMALVAVLVTCFFVASAQFAPMKTEINLGSLKLQSGADVAAAPESQVSPANNTTLNCTVINATINSSISENPEKKAIDLSSYSKDRLSGNLTGYTNIMYPISESSGFTASTASGGGGCGCG
jgi:hypothetical protein